MTKMISDDAMMAIDRFDAACQEWSFQSDHVDDGLEAARKEYADAKDHIMSLVPGWDVNMDCAPKGKMVTVKRLITDKNSASGKSLKIFEEFEPDHVILMSECRKVIKSYWLPEENRWAGFSEKSRPLAWQVWPEWDEGVAAHALELRSPEAAA